VAVLSVQQRLLQVWELRIRVLMAVLEAEHQVQVVAVLVLSVLRQQLLALVVLVLHHQSRELL
jgi:hypothetical protein